MNQRCSRRCQKPSRSEVATSMAQRSVQHQCLSWRRGMLTGFARSLLPEPQETLPDWHTGNAFLPGDLKFRSEPLGGASCAFRNRDPKTTNRLWLEIGITALPISQSSGDKQVGLV